jgi:hypothetical protein
MHEHAIAVLEAAEAEAQAAPIEAPPAVRLALSWLLMSRVAKPWQVRSYWEALTGAVEDENGQPRWLSVYCRKRDMSVMLERWRADVRAMAERPRG